MLEAATLVGDHTITATAGPPAEAGNLTLEGYLFTIDSNSTLGGVTLQYLEPGGTAEISHIANATSAANWFWGHDNGPGFTAQMDLNKDNVLKLASSTSNAIELDPKDGEILIGTAKVVTDASLAGTLAGKTVPGNLNIGGNLDITGGIDRDGITLLSKYGAYPWLKENQTHFGTVSPTWPVPMATDEYIDTNGGIATQHYVPRNVGIWQWQNNDNGNVRTAMHLISYRGSWLYLLDSAATSDSYGRWMGENGWNDHWYLQLTGDPLGTNIFRRPVVIQESFLVGAGSSAPGNESTALGEATTHGKHSTAVGQGVAQSYGSLAIGYNEGRHDTADTTGRTEWKGDGKHSVFEVGVGTSADRRNGFTVLQDGTVEVGKKQTDSTIPLKINADGTVVLSKAQGDVSMGSYGE